MTAVEDAAKVILQATLYSQLTWGTHSDRWNDREWQDRFWADAAEIAAKALDAAGLLIDTEQCKACGLTATACQEHRRGCCQNCTHGEAV